VTCVLFTCAGQRVDVVSAFSRAGATTLAVDANALAPAIYHADAYAIVPRIDDPGYLPALRKLIRQHDVRLVVPLTDLDQLLLAEHRDELGAIVLLPEADVVRRTADKYLAHHFFEEHGIPSPPSWLPGELPDDLEFPVLVKARSGFGSRHIYRAGDRAQLDFFLGHTPVDSFVQRVCTGEEFSIDVFCDLDGRCLNSIPRTMIESKGGESIKGMTIKDSELIEFGRLVAEELGIRGPANIQCFRVAEGRHEVTDVNPRFGGAFPLPHAAGSRYPEFALALARGERPESQLGDFRPGIVMTRFFSHLSLSASADGRLEPFAEELPEPVAGEPGETADKGFASSEETKPVAKRKKTLVWRRARTAARREAARDRDAARYSWAQELAKTAALTIPREKGFLVVPPGGLERAEGVVAAANALVEEIGHAELMRLDTKGGFMALRFLPDSALSFDSPYMRFALSKEVVAPVAAYLGFVPILNYIDVWYSFHGPESPKSSQLWHLDGDDTTQVKVWIRCSNIDRAAGPLTAIAADASDLLAERIPYDFSDNHRLSDEQVRGAIGESGRIAFEGSAGTVDFIDTSRCFHFGSRVAENGTPRRIFMAQYLTPYGAWLKGSDHREKAAFRHLASDDSTELERLLLGVA
jgi:carbamoyl-phosphate synthase large subunit